MDIRFLGPRCLSSATATPRLVDPFLTGNPRPPLRRRARPDPHLPHARPRDHYGDTVDIAKRTGARVAIVEIAGELGEQGVENVSDPNLGGTVEFDWGWVRLVPGLAHVDHAERARSTRRPGW